MASDSSSPIQAQLEALRKAYAAQLAMRVDQVETTWGEVLQAWDPSLLQELHRAVHSLAGSGATFGFMSLSTVARTLEALLNSLIETNSPPLAFQRIQVNTLMASLRQAAQDHGTKLAVPESFVPPLPSTPEPDNRLIYLLEDDEILAQDLALQVGHFGYRVTWFHRSEQLLAAIEQITPAAIISDIVLPASEMNGVDMICEIQQRIQEPMPPVLFISAREDLLARLQVARAGGKAYLTKPVNIPNLVDRLDELTARRVKEPYRVLIVDDEAHLAKYHSLILQQAGFVTMVVTDPLDLMPTLADFSPDLILMDVYMPLCTGLELAAVIRQQPAYVGIPIVFLSTETDLNKQLIAMSSGGDDFLTKGIHPEQLITAVESRAQRARTLRSLMARDSLTGLLNHTKVKEQLNQEIARASRQTTEMAFAMIDLDRFKSVNDTYGHTTGDRVIKSLSRLLTQRLRKTDIIGRYGGEEFAVILPDTNAQEAVWILDQIREGFAQVRQQSEGSEFSSTFSCGVAIFPHYLEGATLTNAADKALYQAKHQGRNQVVLAPDLTSEAPAP